MNVGSDGLGAQQGIQSPEAVRAPLFTQLLQRLTQTTNSIKRSGLDRFDRNQGRKGPFTPHQGQTGQKTTENDEKAPAAAFNQAKDRLEAHLGNKLDVWA